MIRKSLLTLWIALALLAGPLAAACASCCPEMPDRATSVTAGCCDCGQTIERPAAPDASLTGRGAAPGMGLLVSVASLRVETSALAFSPRRVGGLVFSPPSPAATRRL